MAKSEKTGYRSISDIEKVFQRKVNHCFSTLQEPERKGPIILRRFPIRELTDRATNYIAIIKKMQDLFDVMVYRNDHLIEEGLYVVGREYLVDTYVKVLSTIIKVTETNDTIYHTVSYVRHFTTNCIFMVFDLVEYKQRIITEEVKDDCLRDEILTERFVRETPLLRGKKRYYEKLSFIPK